MKLWLVVATFILGSLSSAAQKRPVHIFLAGDSTMAAKADDKRPETGWGEMLEACFRPGSVKVENRAANGRSSKSFIDEGRWQTIIEDLQKGDWVFIQFGHNDQKKDSAERYASPENYRRNLIRFIEDVKAKGGNTIVLTPVVRRRFDKEGKFFDTHGEYPGVVRAVASENRVPLVDLQVLSEKMIDGFGAEGSKKLFLHMKPGKLENYPKGIEDDTHFSPFGAYLIAVLAVGEIRSKNIGLKKYLK